MPAETACVPVKDQPLQILEFNLTYAYGAQPEPLSGNYDVFAA